jgi:hypothetical protein
MYTHTLHYAYTHAPSVGCASALVTTPTCSRIRSMTFFLLSAVTCVCVCVCEYVCICVIVCVKRSTHIRHHAVCMFLFFRMHIHTYVHVCAFMHFHPHVYTRMHPLTRLWLCRLVLLLVLLPLDLLLLAQTGNLGVYMCIYVCERVFERVCVCEYANEYARYIYGHARCGTMKTLEPHTHTHMHVSHTYLGRPTGLDVSLETPHTHTHTHIHTYIPWSPHWPSRLS